MFKEKVPTDFVFQAVALVDSAGVRTSGRAAIKKWTPKESFWRGFKRAARIVAILIGACLPFAFLEPFAFMVWGSVAIGTVVLIIGPILHLKYWQETESFFYVEAECPQCHQQGKLNPYVSTSFAQSFTVLCSACGQTSRCSVE